MKVNLGKCEFGANNVNYLGYRLTPEGILPGLDKLKAARMFKKSDNSWVFAISSEHMSEISHSLGHLSTNSHPKQLIGKMENYQKNVYKPTTV